MTTLAELEACVAAMRTALARTSTIRCDCPRGEREHALEGAAALLANLPAETCAALAVVLLAEIHLAAPACGFDVN